MIVTRSISLFDRQMILTLFKDILSVFFLFLRFSMPAFQYKNVSENKKKRYHVIVPMQPDVWVDWPWKS
jgi:hypothetical protein